MATRQDELRREQRVVDDRYARLDALRAQARARLADVRRAGPSGSPQNRSERDSFATLYEDRLAQLEAVEDRLVFGRLDLQTDSTIYVGRLGLTDDQHASVLTDWRAPAAQAFYRATSAHPDGVARRRHLVTRRRTVTGVEDELLDLDAPADESTLSGEGALLAALSTGRTSQMGDIVATIQAEQDAIIRSGLDGVLVVQGGPGTGKTAVALHRAAYLLYAHRRTLERSGVLLVGPSSSFLRYIDQVLPSLGETGVVSTTVGDLLPGVRATGSDSAEATRVKGLAIMARVVRRAVRRRERVPAHDQAVRVEGHDVVVRRRDVRDAIARARRTQKPHNEARRTFVREMLQRLADQVSDQLGERIEGDDRSILLDDLRHSHDIRVALNLAWLPMSPEWLLEDLYAKPGRLEELAPELRESERRALLRPRGSAWSDADVPLLDEAAELLGVDDQVARDARRVEDAERAARVEYAREMLRSTGAGDGIVDAETVADRFSAGGSHLTTAERAAQDRSWTYGHVVVDEAQELSAMAWRMLARRCPTRSFTVVGDVAQTSSPAGTRDWRAALEPPLGRSVRVKELTVNYRTPRSVADAAQRVARAAGLPVSALTSARDVDGALETVQVGTPDETVTVAVRRLEDAAQTFLEDDGTGRVAVIATAETLTRIELALDDLDPSAAVTAARAGTDPQIVLLTPEAAKGLEFDAVVVVEPATITARRSGDSDLYVALTRPTQRLVVIHADVLPPGIEPSS
ncbi:HelD family protein [Paraoerskovia marina]|uniref:HelD family protein n=1 Tax=Paraoerskovia marina TaxID=545619 RepID=UPI0038B3FFAA